MYEGSFNNYPTPPNCTRGHSITHLLFNVIHLLFNAVPAWVPVSQGGQAWILRPFSVKSIERWSPPPKSWLGAGCPNSTYFWICLEILSHSMSIFRPENDEQNLIPDIVKLHFSNHNFDLADYAVCFSSNFPKLF